MPVNFPESKGFCLHTIQLSKNKLLTMSEDAPMTMKHYQRYTKISKDASNSLGVSNNKRNSNLYMTVQFTQHIVIASTELFFIETESNLHIFLVKKIVVVIWI